MEHIYCVIANAGDGSSSLHWTRSDEVLARMQDLADEGHEAFASGDGLQDKKIKFPDGTLDAWMKLNFIIETTLEDLEDY